MPKKFLTRVMYEFIWSAAQQRAGTPEMQAAAGVDVETFKKIYGNGKVLEAETADMRLTQGTKADWVRAAQISQNFDPTKKRAMQPGKVPVPRIVDAIADLHHTPEIDPTKPH